MGPDGWDYAQDLKDKINGIVRKEITLGPESVISINAMTIDAQQILKKHIDELWHTETYGKSLGG